MIYQIIASHNPQDFFNGDEPENIVEMIESTSDELPQIVSFYINSGYTVIIYGKENNYGIF